MMKFLLFSLSLVVVWVRPVKTGLSNPAPLKQEWLGSLIRHPVKWDLKNMTKQIGANLKEEKKLCTEDDFLYVMMMNFYCSEKHA